MGHDTLHSDFICRKGTYQNIPYRIVFENDFHYTAIAEGQEFCSSFSIVRTESNSKLSSTQGGAVMIDFSAGQNLAEIIQAEMIADDESTDKKEDQLIDLHDGANGMQQATMNEVMMILTGWSFESLCELANIDLGLDPEQ